MVRVFRRFLPILLLTVVTAAHAQNRPGLSLDRRWPGESLEQRDSEQPEDSAPAATATTTEPAAAKRAPAAHAATRSAPPHVIKCSGTFAKDSSHTKLASVFGPDSVDWTDVAGPEGSRLAASVLYPRDPKRRLEVLWNAEDTRSDTQLIVINGQSAWLAPDGLKLGLTVAAIEKINKRPFALKGFQGEDGGRVTDWKGGTLAMLPGGCKVSIRFAPGPKSKVRPGGDLVSDKEIQSNNPALKTVTAKAAEIVIGY
jgi:hypothetical protein